MSFTITRKIDRLPSFPTLCKLADQHSVGINGDECSGSFASRGIQGNYECGSDGIRGTFAGHGATGTFSIVLGEAAVTVTNKPFWLPEMFLRQRIAEGLEQLCDELARSGSSSVERS